MTKCFRQLLVYPWLCTKEQGHEGTCSGEVEVRLLGFSDLDDPSEDHDVRGQLRDEELKTEEAL